MSLITISYYYKKFLPFVIFGFIFCFLFYFTIKFYLMYLDSKRISPTIINPIFSTIAPPRLIDPSQSNKTPISFPATANISLDTIEGRPIVATAAAKVFYLPSPTAKFGYIQNAYLMAKTFGIDTDQTPYEIANKTVSFKTVDKNLQIDITNFNFSYVYDYGTNATLFDTTVIPNETTVKTQANELLQNLGRYPQELSQGTENVVLLHYDSASKLITPVTAVAQANAVEVDFYRPEIDGLSIITSKYPYSQNYVIMAYPDQTPIILKAQVAFFEKEDVKYGTYPLKTGDTAYKELLAHSATIVNSGNGSTDIVIKKMDLVYYDPDFYQEYLEPVFMFLGDNGFAAYVPAIDNSYLKTP